MNALSRGLTILTLALGSSGYAADPPEKLELKNGDRVVFLGNTFFEGALDHGHLECSLALRWPDRKITFRNLGWDGDTVYGHARTGGRRRQVFGEAEEGFQRMIAHLRTLNPTVIFVAYGWNESFEGEAGVDRFQEGFQRLLKEAAAENRRFVLLSPPPLERGFGTDLAFTRNAARDRNDYVTQRNAVLQRYRNVISQIAKKDGHYFVDLFGALKAADVPYSSNGMHPSGEGYQKIANIMAHRLKLPKPKIGLRSPRANKLRATIVKKNTLYFHRWRPRNDAFVYGERKAEQGVAQTEPEKFEPFVAAQEQEIRNQLEAIK